MRSRGESGASARPSNAQLARGYLGGEIDRVEYAEATFRQHHAVTGARGRVLEIGPGGNVAVSALYVHHGADESVCIDSIPWQRGRDGSGKSGLYRDLGVTEDVGRVQFVAPATIEHADFPDASFDIIFSHAAMEHIIDPEKAVANIARLLKPGGVTSHQIDLRDHRDFGRPLEFLNHSDLTWRLLSAGMLSPMNRLRASEWRDLFTRHALKPTIEATETIGVDDEARRRFAKRFRRMPLAELCVIGIHVHAVKTPASSEPADPSLSCWSLASSPAGKSSPL